ncbi:LuxR C-terminal-related transcriptional regulator [Actinoplanes sp. OR16]|uniref:LuxR C-terminal-related transcriptional regulator n=1 Tax=Actinoplanes sp. OR16 TaxID=946334 RepID=UPI000FD78D09|nr:LuxR C-terminal-related transcriptional regulator [Actinoplanes sp. OR16]
MKQDAQFAMAKFRPAALPSTLVERARLVDRLAAGAEARLTVVIGSAGAGKSVLLSSWARSRSASLTSWLYCDEADTDPVRFWTGFVQSIQAVVPAFGATATDLLGAGRGVFADIVASIANDARWLPAGFAVIVDDFHEAEPAVARDMADLVALWPHETARLVLSSRGDPQVRLTRLRLAGDLCELRDRDLSFTFRECGALLARFGVDLPLADLALLHQRSEGWAAALQMTAPALRRCVSAREVARALDVRGQEIAEYFLAEVLDEQHPDLARFMLETSVLGELTEEDCAAVTVRHDAGAMLRDIGKAHLFLVPLDDEGTRFRYHRLVRDVLHAELRRRDRAKERLLQLRAAQWFEASGDARRAARHFLAARDAEHALTLLHDRVVSDFVRDPALAGPLEPGLIDTSLLDKAPDRGVALALDLLLSGDVVRGGAYLDQAASGGPGDMVLDLRLGLARSIHQMLTGHAEEARARVTALRELSHGVPAAGDWSGALSLTLLRILACLRDHESVDREAAVAMSQPGLAEPARAVMVPGLLALARLGEGRLIEAAAAADSAELEARRLGIAEHVFAVDHLRAQAGLALERRDLVRAQELTQRVLSISAGHSPVLEYEAGLDRAAILLSEGLVHEALAGVDTARDVLSGPGPSMLARAAEIEAHARLVLGDAYAATRLAGELAPVARDLLLAKVALASGDLGRVAGLLDGLSGLDPRQALVRDLLRAAAAVERGDPATESILAGALVAARRGGFRNTVVITAPQVTSFLVERAMPFEGDPYQEDLVAAALAVRSTALHAMRPEEVTVVHLTKAERRVLNLLPTHTYRQIAAALFVSPHTVKSHLRSVYRKLGAESRAQALQRAVDLRLL